MTWQPIETMVRDTRKVMVGAWLQSPKGRVWTTVLVFAIADELLWETGKPINWKATHYHEIPDPPA